MGKIVSFLTGFRSGKTSFNPEFYKNLPGSEQDEYLDRCEEQLKADSLEKSVPGDWAWEHLIRIQNFNGSSEANQAMDESEVAALRQRDLIELIRKQYGDELGLPRGEAQTECFKWLYDNVEGLRGRGPLFEEYYWLCRQMNFKRAEEVRRRGLRVVG